MQTRATSGPALLTSHQCTGGTPCDSCASRHSPCVYDASSDQRRKIANQRNVQELAGAHQDLERCKQLLGGIIATIRAGDFNANNDLVRLIRSEVDLSQLAAHVRNECRANVAIRHAYDRINFVIDDPEVLPSPNKVLSPTSPHGSNSQESEASGGGGVSVEDAHPRRGNGMEDCRACMDAPLQAQPSPQSRSQPTS